MVFKIIELTEVQITNIKSSNITNWYELGLEYTMNWEKDYVCRVIDKDKWQKAIDKYDLHS